MAASINKLGPQKQNQIFYTPSFRNVLEIHMAWLRSHPKTHTIAIDPHQAYKYEGDLYGLMGAYGIAKHHHWIVMRLNKIYRAGDVSSEIKSLLVPDLGVLERIRQIHLTKHRR